MMILPERIYYTNLTSDTAREIIKPLPGRQGIDRIYIYDHSRGKHVPKTDNIDFFKSRLNSTSKLRAD